MRILVVYPYVPYPLDRGTYQRTFNLLRGLSVDHCIDFFALAQDSNVFEYYDLFSSFCNRLHFHSFENPKWPNLASRIFDLTPVSIGHWYHSSVVTALNSFAKFAQYDLVYICDIVMVQYVYNCELPIVVDRSRVDLLFQRSQAHMLNKYILDYVRSFESNTKLFFYERKLAKKLALQIVCGEDDAVFLQKNVFKDTPVFVLPNGVDSCYFRPLGLPKADKPTVLFCGAMDYPPNIDALRWYFDKIHAGVLKKIPNLVTLLVGRSPVAEVEAYSKLPGVIVTGTVQDVRPYYSSAWLQIVPLRIGGGSRLKIPECLAMRTPVISTTIGAQGLGLVPDVDFFVADTSDQFVDKIVRLLDCPQIAYVSAINGGKSVVSRLSWPNLSDLLSKKLVSICK